MRPTETIRPTFSRWLAAAVVVCCVLLTGTLVVTRTLVESFGLAAAAVIVAVLAWAMLWRPLVEVSDGGVLVVNPFRTVHVPWPALAEVDTRWSLSVRTVDGRKVSAFAAPAPTALGEGSAAQWAHWRSRAGEEHFRADSRRTRVGLSGQAARAIEHRLRDLQAAGHLDDVRLEGAPVTTRWNVVAIVLLTLAAVGWVLL